MEQLAVLAASIVFSVWLVMRLCKETRGCDMLTAIARGYLAREEEYERKRRLAAYRAQAERAQQSASAVGRENAR